MKVDSALTLEGALSGKEIPEVVRSTLALVEVRYIAADADAHQGQLVVHESLRADVEAIFDELFVARFLIVKAVPICRYGWSDDASILDNNTSAFNYRSIGGTNRLSNHAFGRAIDINPLWNPLVRDGVIEPPGEAYDEQRPGTVVADGPVVKAFRIRGWQWGGEWQNPKDWQHFEKPA